MVIIFWGRVLNLLDYSILSLKRKIIKNLLLAVVFSLVVFLFASFQLIARALTESAELVLTTAPDITVQQMSAGRQVPLAADSAAKLGAVFGIKISKKRIWGYYFDESNGANYTVLGMEQGAFLGSQLGSERQRGDVLMAENVRQLLQLGKRSYFTLFRPDLSQISFKAVTTFPKELDLLTADLICMDIEDARDLFGMEEEFITDLLVTAGNPAEIDTIAGKISELLPGTRVISRNQILKTYKVVFSWRSGLGMICLLTALFAFVILAWDKASGLSREDIREIGILKLVGWHTSDIIALRFCESLVISTLSFLTGYLLAWLHVSLFDGVLFHPILLGWSVLKPTLTLAPSFAMADLLLILSISVVPYLCATAVPGWRAAAVRADSVV